MSKPERKARPKFSEVYKMVILSTAHLPVRDRQRMLEAYVSPAWDPFYMHGRVSNRKDVCCHMLNLRMCYNEELTGATCRLLSDLRSQGFDYVVFDRDGPEIPTLRKYADT